MDLTTLAIAPWDLVLRCLTIYVVMVVGMRLFGKRELGQMTVFDLVLVLLVANAVQPAMTGPDNSLFGGLLIIGTLLALNWVVGQGRLRSRILRRVLQPTSTVLASGGRWHPGALSSQGLDQEDADEALREHGVADVSETSRVELEADGSISVVARGGGLTARPRRRTRTLKRP
ncbi:MAG TPA: YetF domain-containing protein [Candidatus Dormibacteraeota bacterium]|nr:YetF domain-containing protein [Candidatus Dormibacteraeota bacterium]